MHHYRDRRKLQWLRSTRACRLQRHVMAQAVDSVDPIRRRELAEPISLQDLPAPLRLLVRDMGMHSRMLNSPSARAMAVLVGAYLDSILEELLIGHLLDSTSAYELL